MNGLSLRVAKGSEEGGAEITVFTDEVRMGSIDLLCMSEWANLERCHRSI